MSNITVCYSTHRLETLEPTARIMQNHDVIILEESLHVDFEKVLSGEINLAEHLLELDAGYPEFTLGQYRILKRFSKIGKQILQVEPYLDHLLGVQYFLAEDHSPKEIAPNSIAFSVYCAERDATGMLINYYQKAQGNDFTEILSAMNGFAKADAARFILRDSLRANRVPEVLTPGSNIYIEAGSIHLLFYKLLAKNLSGEWHLKVHSVDKEVMRHMDHNGSHFSPGDELSLSYIFGRNVSRQHWALACAQSLIYSKIVRKEDSWRSDTEFPHTKNEIDSISAVKKLSMKDCRILFQRIRSIASEEAAEVVNKYIK